MTEPQWITSLQREGHVTRDLVPFRLFHQIIIEPNGDRLVRWDSWLVDERGKLRRFSPPKPDVLDDLDAMMVGPKDEAAAEAVLTRLNDEEVREYQDRIRGVPIKSLQRQLDMWRELQSREPFVTKRLFLDLEYTTIRMLNAEIQRQLVEQSKATSVLVPSSALDEKEKEADELRWELAKQKALTELHRNTVKIAPKLYADKHFREVDRLSDKEGMKKGAAIVQVAEKYGFSAEGFKQQYYERWYNSKRGKKK